MIIPRLYVFYYMYVVMIIRLRRLCCVCVECRRFPHSLIGVEIYMHWALLPTPYVGVYMLLCRVVLCAVLCVCCRALIVGFRASSPTAQKAVSLSLDMVVFEK